MHGFLIRERVWSGTIRRGLAGCGTGEGVIRRTKGGHEDLCFCDFASDGINQRDSLTGVVDKQLLEPMWIWRMERFRHMVPWPYLTQKAGVFEGQVVSLGLLSSWWRLQAK